MNTILLLTSIAVVGASVILVLLVLIGPKVGDQPPADEPEGDALRHGVKRPRFW